MSSPPLAVTPPAWQRDAEKYVNPTGTLLHEDFKDTYYKGSMPGQFTAIMDEYAEYLSFLLTKFRIAQPAPLIDAYRKSRRGGGDAVSLFLHQLRPVQKALRGWQPKTLVELAATFDIDSHQAKHYQDSGEKNVAKFNCSWSMVHNLIRAGAAKLAEHYQGRGFTVFPDGLVSVTEGGRSKIIGRDGKPTGAGSEVDSFRIQIWVNGETAGGHGYPVSDPEFKQFSKKRLNTGTGNQDDRSGVQVNFVTLRWEDLPTAQAEGDKKHTLR